MALQPHNNAIFYTRGNPSSTQRLHCRAMSFTDLVMQGIQNTHSSTGMSMKVLVKYKDIEYSDCWATGPCRRNII